VVKRLVIKEIDPQEGPHALIERLLEYEGPGFFFGLGRRGGLRCLGFCHMTYCALRPRRT